MLSARQLAYHDGCCGWPWDCTSCWGEVHIDPSRSDAQTAELTLAGKWKTHSGSRQETGGVYYHQPIILWNTPIGELPSPIALSQTRGSSAWLPRGWFQLAYRSCAKARPTAPCALLWLLCFSTWRFFWPCRHAQLHRHISTKNILSFAWLPFVAFVHKGTWRNTVGSVLNCFSKS